MAKEISTEIQSSTQKERFSTTSLALAAENLLAANYKIEQSESGKDPIEEVIVPTQDKAGFELTAEQAQALVSFRELLTVAAKMKLDLMACETQVEIATAVIENWV